MKSVNLFSQLVVVVAVFFTMFVLSQQVVRQLANEELGLLGNQIVSAIGNKDDYQRLLPEKIDIAKTDSKFVIVFDDNGNVVTSTVVMDGKPVKVPAGVLANAKEKGVDKVTWQPKLGVREAVVVTHYSGKDSGYVLVGKSLKETEGLTDSLFRLVMTALIGTSAAVVGLSFLGGSKKSSR